MLRLALGRSAHTGKGSVEANQYQAQAMRTANAVLTDHDLLVNASLGLAGEVGEVCDLIKKHLMQGHALDHAKLTQELGDVLWYVALACDTLGLQMGEVMTANLAKLSRRYPEGFSVERSLQRVTE